MTPEQEARILKELGRVNSNVDLLRHDQLATVAEMRARFDRVDLRLDRHGRRLKALEQKVEPDSDVGEITGSHPAIDIALLRAEQHRLAEAESVRRHDSLWAKRQLRIWMVSAIGAIAMLVLTGGGSVVFWLLTRHHP